MELSSNLCGIAGVELKNPQWKGFQIFTKIVDWLGERKCVCGKCKMCKMMKNKNVSC